MHILVQMSHEWLYCTFFPQHGGAPADQDRPIIEVQRMSKRGEKGQERQEEGETAQKATKNAG